MSIYVAFHNCNHITDVRDNASCIVSKIGNRHNNAIYMSQLAPSVASTYVYSALEGLYNSRNRVEGPSALDMSILKQLSRGPLAQGPSHEA